jgi:hypothetical protein
MLNEIVTILSAFEFIPKRMFDVTSGYIGFLSLIMKRHTFAMAGEISGLDQSRFCAMLNNPETLELSAKIFSRALRRRLKRCKKVNGRLVVIIDATIIARKSRHVENVGRYHSGSGKVWGHKFVNFVIFNGEQCIPIESIPVYTKKYARENKLKRRTEAEIVTDWVESFKERALLPDEVVRSAVFLLDAGYDAKCIQGAIKGIGADFVMALKSSRIINGKQAAELFRSTRRWLASESIRLHVGNGGKGSRRNYSVRTAREANMKGFGLVTVICSKAMDRKGKPTKFIASSDLEMSSREIVKWYSIRWRVEMWHREMKQNFGFIDCRSRRFIAIQSHINFCLTAYLLQKETGKEQMRVEEYVRLQEAAMMKQKLQGIRREATKFGAAVRLKPLIESVIQGIAA